MSCLDESKERRTLCQNALTCHRRLRSKARKSNDNYRTIIVSLESQVSSQAEMKNKPYILDYQYVPRFPYKLEHGIIALGRRVREDENSMTLFNSYFYSWEHLQAQLPSISSTGLLLADIAL